MELNYLVNFIAVAETLNFRKAAELCFVSQPALSRQIAELEREMETPLLVRDTRNVSLTPAGELFLEHARSIVRQCSLLRQQMADLRSGMLGDLSVGYHGFGNVTFLTAALHQLNAAYPRIRIRIELDSSAALRQGLENGTLDAIMILAPVVRDLPDLVRQTVVHEVPSVVLPLNHPLAQRESVPLSALKGETFLLLGREKSSQMFDALVQLCLDAGFSPAVRSVPDDAAQSFQVAAGNGVGLCPSLVRGRQDPFGTVRLPLEGTFEGFDRILCWKRGHRNPCLPIFLQVLSQVVCDFDSH